MAIRKARACVFAFKFCSWKCRSLPSLAQDPSATEWKWDPLRLFVLRSLVAVATVSEFTNNGDANKWCGGLWFGAVLLGHAIVGSGGCIGQDGCNMLIPCQVGFGSTLLGGQPNWCFDIPRSWWPPKHRPNGAIWQTHREHLKLWPLSSSQLRTTGSTWKPIQGNDQTSRWGVPTWTKCAVDATTPGFRSWPRSRPGTKGLIWFDIGASWLCHMTSFPKCATHEDKSQGRTGGAAAIGEDAQGAFCSFALDYWATFYKRAESDEQGIRSLPCKGFTQEQSSGSLTSIISMVRWEDLTWISPGKNPWFVLGLKDVDSVRDMWLQVVARLT